ncbi:MAG: oligosaccharide flippase family protein [Deltaproteobacteria bacterium]|nr:oligosaccharide flippase family protein [Deltaproteobacteria bacterium]
MASFSINLTSQWLATLYTAAVSLGLTFILGRVLGPDGFGSYSYILTIATLFFILQDGGFKTLLFREKTLPSEELKSYEDRLFSWALGHSAMTTVVGAFFVWVIPSQYRLGIVAAVICFGFQAVVNFISSELRAKGLFPRDAMWQAMVRTSGAAGILLGMFLVTPVPWIIFAGWSFGLLVCLLLSPRPVPRPLLGGFRIRDIRKPCMYLMAIDAATTVYFRCDIILLERLAEPALVGYYAAAYRFLDGVVLLAAPLSVIWFRKLRIVWKDEKAFWAQIGWMSMIMLAASVLVIAVGSLFSWEIMVLTFGDEYMDSARLLPWLLGALIFLLPNGILTQAAIARNRERVYAVAAGAGAVLNIGLNLFLIPEFGGFGAAWATIVTEAFLTVALIFGLRTSGSSR